MIANGHAGGGCEGAGASSDASVECRRTWKVMISTKEGLNLAKGSPDPDAASRKIQRSGQSLLDFSTSKDEQGLIGWRVVAIP